MTEVIIRPYHICDSQAVEDITYRTGFKGEDLFGRNYFDDKRLLYLIFIYYYPKFEPEHCFVVEDVRTRQVVGFICGTPDTIHQEKLFIRHIHWRILIRAFTFTVWRYPKTFTTLMKMSRIRPGITESEYSWVISNYPAHLHINLIPEYQRMGIGSRLIHHFANHLKGLGVEGVHLQTSSYNQKAVPFYHKLGFDLVNRAAINHFLFSDLELLTFAMKIPSAQP